MFRIIDSKVVEAIGVRVIGLTYFSIIVFGGFTFGTGITFADFHVSSVHAYIFTFTQRQPCAADSSSNAFTVSC